MSQDQNQLKSREQIPILFTNIIIIFYSFLLQKSIFLMTRQLDQFKVYSDTKLKLKYEIMNKLGEGCFGTIYKAINRLMKRQVALKLQFHDSLEDSRTRSNLSNQIAILQRLKGIKGVPKLYGAGKWNHGYYMEVQLLSSTLHDEKNKEFTQSQICLIASQLIQILKQIHGRGIVHQDLKPQNIMRDQKGSFLIIDYGLSTLFNKQSNQRVKKTGFVGTPRYASLAAHLGNPQRPKDDIQSLLYVIGAMYMKKAPWFQLKGPASKKLQKIQKYKEANSMMWFKQCGQSFSAVYEYLMDLEFNDEVNYTYILQLFQTARKAKALQTVKLNRVNTVDLNTALRRKSDTLKNSPIKMPSINIRFVEQPKSGRHKQKLNTLATKYDNQEGSSQHNNFSQVAQDGYMELIQILTEKIFNTIDQHKDENEDAVVNSICGREPAINSLSKYEVLMFKNPFEAS